MTTVSAKFAVSRCGDIDEMLRVLLKVGSKVKEFKSQLWKFDAMWLEVDWDAGPEVPMSLEGIKQTLAGSPPSHSGKRGDLWTKEEVGKEMASLLLTMHYIAAEDQSVFLDKKPNDLIAQVSASILSRLTGGNNNLNTVAMTNAYKQEFRRFRQSLERLE